MDIIEAIEIAIDAEIKAKERYKGYVQLAEDAETRSLFEHLMRWEADHEKMLRDRLATIKLIRKEH